MKSVVNDTKTAKTSVLDAINGIAEQSALLDGDISALADYLDEWERERGNSEQSDVALYAALSKYKDAPSDATYQNLCVELSDFCRAVYAASGNEDQRLAYRRAVKRAAI